MYNQTPVNTIFGDGAPTEAAGQGTLYVDQTANSLYMYYGGAWHAFGGGGGGGSNVYPYPPYGVTIGYSSSFVAPGNIAPYTTIEAPPGINDPSYSKGGYVNLYAGVGGDAPYCYGGNIAMYGGNALHGYYAYGGGIFLVGGSGNGSAHGYGGQVFISPGAGLGPNGYGADLVLHIANGTTANGRLTIQNLPIAPPGGFGHVWNNGGVLNIT